MDYQCEFCGSELNSERSLIAHKKTAKYCLELRGIESEVYKCLCLKEFSVKSNLRKHEKVCEKMIQELLKEELEAKDLEIEEMAKKMRILEKKNTVLNTKVSALRRENQKLKTEAAVIASDTTASIYKEEYKAIRDKPTTVYNTTNNKLKLVNTATIEPFTVETVRNRLNDNKYTYGDFMSGLSGIKRFIMGIITKDDEKNYVTTDTSRPNFHRLEDTKKWIGDKGALFLNELFDEMKPVVQEHWTYFANELNTVEDAEERDDLMSDMDRIKPIASAILSKNDSKQRKELMEDVIKYIKPRVAI